MLTVLGLRPDDVRRMIADFVHDNLGPRSKASDSVILRRKRARCLGLEGNTHASNAVASVNQRYLSVTETELINSAQIARVGRRHKSSIRLPSLRSNGALSGCAGGLWEELCMAQCLSQLSDTGTPYLCLRSIL